MSPPRIGPSDRVATLPDGRHLGYATYGRPDGNVVVNCHAGWLCRADVSPLGAVAAALGLRLVSPDRPGIGLSDSRPGYNVLSWVDNDLIGLVEHLGVDRFAVMGWSAGAQYALAAAHRLDARVSGCAVIAGTPPMDGCVDPGELNRTDRLLSWLSARRPATARAYFSGLHIASALVPRLTGRLMTAECEPGEVAAVRALGNWGPANLTEGTRRPGGVIDDYVAMDSDWGFTLEDVRVPVRVYHGTSDRVVPYSWGRVVAERIPGCDFTTYRNEGHLVGITRRREPLEWLAASFDADGS